jgi:hypothetical protein
MLRADVKEKLILVRTKRLGWTRGYLVKKIGKNLWVRLAGDGRVVKRKPKDVRLGGQDGKEGRSVRC